MSLFFQKKLNDQNISNEAISVHLGLQELQLIQVHVIFISKKFNEIVKLRSEIKNSLDSPSKYLVRRLKEVHKEIKEVDDVLKTRKSSLETALKIVSLQEGLRELNAWMDGKKKLMRRKVNRDDYAALIHIRDGLSVSF